MSRATAIALLWLQGRQHWEAPRVELNAIGVVFAAQNHNLDDTEVFEDFLADRRLCFAVDCASLAIS